MVDMSTKIAKKKKTATENEMLYGGWTNIEKGHIEHPITIHDQ